MKRILLTTLMAAAALTGQSAWADCAAPAGAIDVPSGSSATRDQMLAAQRAVKAYDSAVKAYTDCLQQAGDSSNKGNEAVDNLQKVAARFNEELRSFKEKNGAS